MVLQPLTSAAAPWRVGSRSYPYLLYEVTLQQNALNSDVTHMAMNYKIICKAAGHQDCAGLFLVPAAESSQVQP